MALAVPRPVRPPKPGRSLADLHPELAAQWDYEANGDLRPEDVSPGSNLKAHWVCTEDPRHLWDAAIQGRVRGAGCSVCRGLKVLPGVNDLATLYPGLAKQWDYEANGDLRPEDVSSKSNKRASWICSTDSRHRWDAVIAKRAEGTGCSVCAGKTVMPGVNDLESAHPVIAAQWDRAANGKLSPNQVTPGSQRRVWWLCPTDSQHRWEASIAKRVSGGGCPVCSGHKLLPGVNDLATVCPELAAQWDDERNGDLCPHEVAPGSGTKVWWRCTEGHSWEVSTNGRLHLKSLTIRSGCPICAGKQVLAGFNDLATTHLETAAEWDYSANGALTPQCVTAGSGKRAWWVCSDDDGHCWDAVVNCRALGGDGCPYCSGYRASPGVNDLATTHPEIAAQWDHDANGDLTPQSVSAGSNKLVHWGCSENALHLWIAKPVDRTGKNQTGCPYCSNQRVLIGCNDLATTHPEIAALWDHSKNGNLTDKGVTAGSATKVWWLCLLGHSWLTTPDVVTQATSTGCPFCSGRSVLVGFNDLVTTHPKIAAEWDYARNIGLDLQDITAKTKKHAHWVCGSDRKHQWETTVNARCIGGSGCPYCSGHKLLVGFNDLVTTHPEIAAQWDAEANGDLTPRGVSAGSSLMTGWKCDKHPDHKWKARVTGRRKSGCPYCAGKRVQPGFNDLATTHPEIAAEWDYERNDRLEPNAVTMGSNTRAHWRCSTNPKHLWETKIASRASDGSGCPSCAGCVSKGEADLAALIASFVEGEPVLRGVREYGGKELDIIIPSRGVAVEFNGLYWHSDARVGREHPDYHFTKSALAASASLHLIHVWEDDWRDRRTLVLRNLLTRLDALDAAAAIDPTLLPFTRRVDADSCSIAQVPADEAAAFLAEHHLEGPQQGSVNLGLRDPNGTLVAFLVASVSDADTTATVERYATSCVVAGGLAALEVALARQLPDVAFLEVSVDIAAGDSSEFKSAEWLPGGITIADYVYVVGGSRVARPEFSLERFRTDPDLIFVEGATERALADLNSLRRIWDAGKVRWVKPVGAAAPAARADVELAA